MRALKLLDDDPMVVYRSIGDSKEADRKRILKKITTKVLFAHMSYRIKNLTSLFPANFTADERTALLHCYTGSTVAYQKLRDELFQNAGRTCPFCGINPPETLDHYIPKDTHPEFSVYIPNLIPCCFSCNTTKGQYWFDKNSRWYLHAYFDSIPDTAECLIATVELNGKAPVFEYNLRPDPLVPTELFELLAIHCKKLDLLRQYREASGEEYTNMGDFAFKGITAVQLNASITQAVRLKRSREGPLSWRAAMWRSVLQNNLVFQQILQEANK